MLKIGDFSKLSRVSIRMLRHYDDIGLLKPAETDAFTGYRRSVARHRTDHRAQGYGLCSGGYRPNPGNIRRPGKTGRVSVRQRRGTVSIVKGNGVQADASGNSQKTAEKGAEYEL